MHGLEARHIATEPVKEATPKGEIVWAGDVEVFDAVGTKVYAWSEPAGGTKRRFFAVLGVGKIDSAAMAVRITVLGDAKGF